MHFLRFAVAVLSTAFLPAVESSSTSLGAHLYTRSHRSVYARRLEITRDNASSRALKALQAREDYTCGLGRQCNNKACCGESGNCGYGAAYCGKGCTSNCDAVAECGKDSKDGKTTCPLNTCCSQYGFCGTTKDFCGKGCQSNCNEKPSPPLGSFKGMALSRVIGYYEAWGARSTCHKTSPHDLPLAALTHLNYAFAYLDPTSFKLTTMDASTSISLFDDMSDLKTTNPRLEIFVSIGGWTFSDNDTYTQPIFGNIARSSENRQLFADEVASFLTYYGFDGIDLDWEYPGAPDRGGKKEDTENYVELVKTLRATLDKTGRPLGITFTAPSSYWYLQWFDLPGMMKYCDWINLMSYDLHGTWDSTNPIGAITQGHTNLTEIKLAAELFWRVNIPTHKIALGFGFYGRAFTLSDPSCTTPGCPFSGGAKPGVCTKASGYLAYYEVQEILKKNPSIKIIHDKQAAVKYFTFDKDQWVSFDDQDTFKQKVEWANSVGFSGSLIWASDLDDFEFTAHASLTGKDKSMLNSPSASKQAVLDSPMAKENLESYLRKDCYVQQDSLTACKLGDNQVGYDKAGLSKDYKPICCPKGSAMTKCLWRGGNGGTNAGRDCNGICHPGEVKITMSAYGGLPGESSEKAHCTRGQKAFCCQLGIFNAALSQCSWSSGVGSSCGSDQQGIAYIWGMSGGSTILKHGNKFCCPKDHSPPLLDCHWVGKGDCADNSCGASEVTLLTNSQGESFRSCSWGRQRSLCCTINNEKLQTHTCDFDLCSLPEYRAACGDEALHDDEEGGTSIARRSPYTTSDGRTLWTYEIGGGDEMDDRSDLDIQGRSPPGRPRRRIMRMKNLAGTLYTALELTVTSRPYRPGLKSLKGDGSDTLLIRGGYNLLKEACSSTAMRFLYEPELPKKGFHMEHVREINMIYGFVESLLAGTLSSGPPMVTRLDPMAVYRGWNKIYPVSLPHIGAVVRDMTDYTIPMTPNDRIFETLGSYAYRGGVAFLPASLNMLKGVLMASHSPLGSRTGKFESLVRLVAGRGDEEALNILLTAMQGTVAVFNYLNDVNLNSAFTEAGRLLTAEMSRADEYMPELKGILEAWKEWEPDYYNHVVSNARNWLISRGAMIAQKFSVHPAENPNALKLVSEAARIVSQIGQIRSPLREQAMKNAKSRRSRL
ncbi:hypothetical protein E4U50_007948 [Claviceps purpurea]|nr:hypothetical protein E4U50_007948 [Claviceps purpurea]